MKRLYRIAGDQRVRSAAQWALRAVGPVILAVLLWRVVDFGELRGLLGDMRYGWAIAALGAAQVIILLRTFRWIELHRAFGLPRAGFFYQFRLSYATGLATVVLPQILNPFSRLVLLLQDGYRARRAAGGAALEKLLELAAYVTFGLYGSIVLASTFGGLRWWALGVAVLVAAGGVAAYAARARLRELALALLERIPGLAQEREADEVARAAIALDRATWVRLAGWSTAVALMQGTMLYFLTRSLGVDLSFGFMLAVWGVIAFSILLPLSVNGLGTREAILVAAFNGVDRSTDAAVAIGLLTVIVVAVGTVPGAIEWLWRFWGGRAPVAAEEPSLTAAPPATARPQGERG